MTSGAFRAEHTAHISRFVLTNPELIKLWFDDFIAPGDIAPRVYHNNVRPDLSIEEVVERFKQEQTRVRDGDARLPPESDL